MILLNKLDLEKSFDKLKKELKTAANGINSEKPESYAHSFGRLETAVKIHLIACTHEDMKSIQDYLNEDGPNDLKDIKFN